MLTLFVARDKPFKVYITTPDKYSQALIKHGIDPDLAAFQNVSMETLMLITDGQVDCKVLELER